MRSITLALTLLIGCLPVQFSGSSKPTDHTIWLTAEDIAYVERDVCAQTWVTGNDEADLDTALQMLADRGVLIKRGNPVAMATALAYTLRVSKDYEELDAAGKVRLLTHELVHYCQRDEQGVEFEAAYLNSPGRWRAEVPAYRQTFRTAVAQCLALPDIEAVIDRRVDSMRDKYLLWDLDPGQYESVTREVWRTELVVREGC